MSVRSTAFFLVCAACLSICAGCGGSIAGSANGSAAIVGSIIAQDAGGKYATAAQLGCPDVVVNLDDAAVNVELKDDCTFLIDDVVPDPRVVLQIELPALGVSGTLELLNVREAELIEILVEADNDSLTISILRRATPAPVDELPVVISDNNVTIFLPVGIYDQTLTVEKNNFALVGEAGDGCDATEWSVITGDVFILGNNATFRNVRFDGVVQISGNNAEFINTCLGTEFVIFGNNVHFEDDDDDDDDDDDEGDDD